MDRRLRVLLWTLAGGGAIAVLVVLGLAGTGGSGDRVAPQLPRERLAGARTTLSGLLAGAHGRSALVVFWASWCGPCAHEAPELEALASSAAGRGRVVAVDWSDPETQKARGFVKRYAWSFPVLRDGDGAVGNEYRMTSLPTSFVIDSRGRISDVLRGPQTLGDWTRALAGAERA